ncbi:hypothetical protein QLX08_006127 [Tetragonisca angustula]
MTAKEEHSARRRRRRRTRTRWWLRRRKEDEEKVAVVADEEEEDAARIEPVGWKEEEGTHAVVCGEQDFEVCPSDGKSPWHAQRGGTQCMERSQSGKGFPRDIVHSGGYRRSTFKLFSDLAGS